MTDFWSFLLQTLTASGAAALLLTVKAMFRDKLSPRWQFGVWSLLALMLLLPAGLGGRYALVNWPLFVEALKSALTGQFGTLTRVLAPVPLPAPEPPRSVWDWLYAVYLLGAGLLLARYLLSYIRLRLALKKGRPADMGPVRAVAERHGLPVCPAVEAEGLPSAFVCGVFRPVLALPAGARTDEKVLLHELLHLRHRDAAWGLVIGLFRCLHWCNPLLWWCADWAGNDLESLCDQRVLERLEGEERREYGRILLSMADERYARAPGTSSIANGGKNIRRRIEAIARFKKYPAGMGLVSVCMVLMLAVPLLAGAKAAVPGRNGDNIPRQMAAARTNYCTTCAGALDTYAKAVMLEGIAYRAMCAPLAEQNALAQDYRAALDRTNWGYKDFLGLHSDVARNGYQIYNLTQVSEDAYEGLLVLQLVQPPNWMEREDNYVWLAAQRVRAEKEGPRWVALPLEEFQAVHAVGWMDMPTGCAQLPAREYEAAAGDFTLRLRRQTLAWADSQEETRGLFSASSSFSTIPQPDGTFHGRTVYTLWARYTGDPEDKGRYTHIAAAYCPMEAGGERPVLARPGLGEFSSASSDGSAAAGVKLTGNWDSLVYLSGGGTGNGDDYVQPDCWAADLYLNGVLTDHLTLLPVEGGDWVYD